MKWGLERSRQENVPAYLESTLDALPFYSKLGFTGTEKIKMVLPGGRAGEGGAKGDGGAGEVGEGNGGEGGGGAGERGREERGREEEEVYEEACLIYRPDASVF